MVTFAELIDFDESTIRTCNDMMVTFGVQPHHTWGALNESSKVVWGNLNCNHAVSIYKHSHLHDHNIHNSSKHSDELDRCKALQEEFKVVPFVTWGTLDEAGQDKWKGLNCDRLGHVEKAKPPKLKHHSHHISNTPILLYDKAQCINCTMELLHLNAVTAQSLAAILTQFESENVNISYVVIRSTSDQAAEIIGEEVDKFIVTRPWWIVDLEPYKWFPSKRDLILFRTPKHIEAHMAAFTRHQFPPDAVCAASPLFVSNLNGDAWGNRLLNAFSHWKHHLESIFYIFSASFEENGVAFAEDDMCPQPNKWECLFLPMSNCTVPDELKSCQVRDRSITRLL